MTRKELSDSLTKLSEDYFFKKTMHQKQVDPIIFELLDKWKSKWLFEAYGPSSKVRGAAWNYKIPTKIKLSGSYRRKNIVRIFSQLGLKVTRYTREYGKTIVHFEPISDSKK